MWIKIVLSEEKVIKVIVSDKTKSITSVRHVKLNIDRAKLTLR